MELLAANTSGPVAGHRPVSAIQKAVVLGLLLLGTIVVLLLLSTGAKSPVAARRGHPARSTVASVSAGGR
jgi:hypothetical protein